MFGRSLPRLQVVVPCHKDWHGMRGDDRVRFCDGCQRNVYNVKAMSRREAAKLLRTHGERLPCLRIFRRPDGTIVTRDCLAPFKKTAARLWVRLSLLAAGAGGFWLGVFQLRSFFQGQSRVHEMPPNGTQVEPQAAAVAREQTAFAGRAPEEATMGAFISVEDRRRREPRQTSLEASLVTQIRSLAKWQPKNALAKTLRVNVTLTFNKRGRVTKAIVSPSLGFDDRGVIAELETYLRAVRFKPTTQPQTVSFPLIIRGQL